MTADEALLETPVSELFAAEPALDTPAPHASTAQPASEPDLAKPRLIITQMVLENFKSYAGRQVIGPFHRSFSAVVGPNGSGKSNVIDALLFVFGYRANKIRQGKLSELIHSSKNAANLTQCMVSVHFKEIIDAPDGSSSSDVPGSELVVSRTATHTNQSKYLVNGSPSTYAEVTTMLRKKGIDLDHKRFLILQGEVENIAQMKPMGQSDGDVGLLEYLEDIIGTSAYKPQIEAARAAVDDLNTARSERLHRVKIVEKEMNALVERRNEAVAFVRAENDVTRHKSQLFQKRLHESQAKAESLRSRFTDAQNAHTQERTRAGDFRSALKDLENARDVAAREAQTLDARARDAAQALARFEREEVQLQVNRKHVVGKAKKLRDAAEKDAHNTSQTRTTIAALEADAARGAAETADLEQRLEVERATLEEISDSLRGKTEALTAELAERQRELAPWREKIATHQSRLDIAQTELRLLDERAAAGGKLLEAAKHELRRLREVRVEKAQFAEARVEELAGVNDELEAADKAVQKAEGRVHVLRDAAAAARRSEEEARAALGATQAQSNVLKALLRQRDVGAIEGIHGRLGSLGAIDDAYDVAVSSACGGALDSIVVQTVRAGQQCVEYLRRNNVGRARFVILDTLRAPPAGPPRDTPEGVPRLYDLVRPADPCFAPAFYHAIGDTLVARDMEQARRVAYGRGKRFRVVSLDGAVLEAAGTMSGGGNRVARGAMSSRQATVDGGAVTEATVARLAAAREAADGECAEQQAALRTLQAKHKALQRRYDDLDALLPRLELELKAVDEQVQMAKKRARDLAAAQDQPVADDPASAERRAQIEARAAAETTAISELQAECATIDSAIAALQERIMQAGGIRLRAQKAKVDGLLERITTVADERVRWEASLAKARSDLARAERAAATRAAQLAELEEQLATVTAEIDAKSAASIELRGTADAARAAAETKREELDRVKDEFDARTAEANEVRAKEAALKRKLDDIERALADATRAVNYWSSEHDHLALHVIDEEDNIDNDGAADTAAAEDSDSDAMAVDVPPATLPRLTPDALDALDAAALEARIEQLEARLQRSRPNLSVLAEYARRAREFRARSSELETITAQRDAAQRELDGLRTRRLDEFMAGFSVISYRLKEMYQMVTLGGNAELELVDSLDPFSEGIVFSVMPPKKSWKNISNLSGGEKTLSSLALVFALHQYKPTPLYVMDEIDAALDFRNVSIVANYIKERTRNAQFVIISLRNNMFELADRLIGIYKTDNRTKSIALDTEHTVAALHGESAGAAAA